MGFAGPHGRWDPSLDDTLEDLGYLYSSDFQLGYDDFPFYPWKGTRFSSVLQIPIHPVCEGLFLEAGVDDPRVIGDYLREIVLSKIDAEELAIVYGHPERRLGRMPEVLAMLVPGDRSEALGLAHHALGAGEMVAMAVRSKVAGHLARRSPPGYPVRRVGYRI